MEANTSHAINLSALLHTTQFIGKTYFCLDSPLTHLCIYASRTYNNLCFFLLTVYFTVFFLPSYSFLVSTINSVGDLHHRILVQPTNLCSIVLLIATHTLHNATVTLRTTGTHSRLLLPSAVYPRCNSHTYNTVHTVQLSMEFDTSALTPIIFFGIELQYYLTVRNLLPQDVASP